MSRYPTEPPINGMHPTANSAALIRKTLCLRWVMFVLKSRDDRVGELGGFGLAADVAGADVAFDEDFEQR